MRSHPVGLDVWFSVGPFVYYQTSCVRKVKALLRLHGCAGSPEFSLVAYVISTIISLAGSFMKLTLMLNKFLQLLISKYPPGFNCWTYFAPAFQSWFTVAYSSCFISVMNLDWYVCGFDWLISRDPSRGRTTSMCIWTTAEPRMR